MCYKSAIIHISDTEFGPKNIAEQKDIKDQCKQLYKAVMDNFISDVRKTVINEHGIKPSKIGLVISGDITDKGNYEEYKKAQKWIKYTINKLKIPPSQVAIIPGNHDVNWDDCRKAYEEVKNQNQSLADIKLKEQIRCSPKKLAEFSRFFKSMCGKDFKIQTPTKFEAFKKLGVVLVGLDTTYPSLWSDEDNYGNVQYEQIETAGNYRDEQLKKKGGLVSIAVMHHSLLPDLESEKSSFLHHAENVRTWLEQDRGFNIVLCGHEHTDKKSRSINGNFNILVTGSFGLCLAELMDEYKEGQKPKTNKYQVILIASDGQMKFLYHRLNRADASQPTGKWEKDESGGQPFDKITLRHSETIIEKQPKVDADIDIGKPVKSLTPESNMCYFIGVKVNEADMSTKQVKAVIYKIEPGGERIDGDPNCDFLASLPVRALEGRSVSAYITLNNGREIHKENISIPASCYDPFTHSLCFDNY